MRQSGARTVSLIVVAAIAAGAPLAARAEVVRPGEDSYDLGLLGRDTPDILKKAKADPYAAPAAPACQTIPQEIAELDAVLGPDADTPARKQSVSATAGHFLFKTVRGFIPHRDVVRFVTGAGKKDKERNEAAMAGWSRRGFLKGMQINLGCGDPAKAAVQAAADTATVAASAETQVIAAQPRPVTEEAAETQAIRGPAAPTPVAADAAILVRTAEPASAVTTVAR